MSKLTAKQQAYVDARLAGAKQIDAARMAGYAGSHLSVQAANLAKHPAIKKAIVAGKRKIAKADRAQLSDDEDTGMLDKYETPADFMRHCMNNPKLPKSMRWQSAKELMPYEHAKVGESGKKEKRKDVAENIANGGTVSKFRTKTPPKLRAVN